MSSKYRDYYMTWSDFRLPELFGPFHRGNVANERIRWMRDHNDRRAALLVLTDAQAEAWPCEPGHYRPEVLAQLEDGPEMGSAA